MPERIDQLDVEQHQVEMGQAGGGERLPGEQAVGLHGGVDVRALEQGQQLTTEGLLQSRLTAGQRHPAAGDLVKAPVAQEQLDQFRRSELPPHQLQCPGRTDLDASAAAGAAAPIEPHRAVNHCQCPLGTAIDTLTAADTALTAQGQFHPGIDELRVVAPGAVQRAALAEHRGADARAVVQGVAADVANQPTGHGRGSRRCSCLAM